MKRKLLLINCFFAFLAVFTCAAFAEDFSADMVNITPQGILEGKIYSSGDKVRMEVPSSITIARPDLGKVWMLMPDKGMYMEQTLDKAQQAVTSENIPGEIKRELISDEKVNNVNAKKYKITYKQAGSTAQMFQWISPKYKFPVKMADINGAWAVEYRNIKLGRQPDSLFELPAGYKKFSLGASDMAGMLKDMAE